MTENTLRQAAIDTLVNHSGESRVTIEALLVNDATGFTDDESWKRAEILHRLYLMGYSLREVGIIADGLSKERIRQIFGEFDMETRPRPGSASWRKQQETAGASG